MNLYEVLGIEEQATSNEIKRAYKKLALKHHPDKGGRQEDFQKVTNAFSILSNQEKRDEYDENTILNPKYESTDPFDIFQQFFHNHKKTQPEYYNLYLSLEEVYNGCEKLIELIIEDTCVMCIDKKCLHCKGKGFRMKVNSRALCGDCSGTGRHSCTYCDSTCIKTKKRTSNISFKPFVCANYKQHITRNFYIVVKYKIHPRIKLKSNTMILEHTISLRQALTETNFGYKHLNGIVYNIIFSGQIHNRDVKILPGLGFNNDDMYIHFFVHYPRTIDIDCTVLNNVFGGFNIDQPPMNDSTDVHLESLEESDSGNCSQM